MPAAGLLLATMKTEGRSGRELGWVAPSTLTPVRRGGSWEKTLITRGFDPSATLANEMVLCESSEFDCWMAHRNVPGPSSPAGSRGHVSEGP